jgi:hypothetical protein
MPTLTNDQVDDIVSHYYDTGTRPPAVLTDRVMVKPQDMYVGDVIRVPQASVMFDTAMVQRIDFAHSKVYLFRPHVYINGMDDVSVDCVMLSETLTLSTDSKTEFERLGHVPH